MTTTEMALLRDIETAKRERAEFEAKLANKELELKAAAERKELKEENKELKEENKEFELEIERLKKQLAATNYK